MKTLKKALTALENHLNLFMATALGVTAVLSHDHWLFKLTALGVACLLCDTHMLLLRQTDRSKQVTRLALILAFLKWREDQQANPGAFMSEQAADSVSPLELAETSADELLSYLNEVRK